MESNRRVARDPLTRVARVVPDVAAFAVDDGFAYAVPDGIDLEVGAVVRVPLGGRRVRGWVIDIRPGPTEGLREVISRSGDLAVFTNRTLGVLRWAALHYVAPMASLVGKATPPNLPRSRKPRALPPVPPVGESPLPGVSATAAAGKKGATHVWPDAAHPEAVGALLAPVVGAGRSGMVVCPTVVEADAMHKQLVSMLGERIVMATSSRPAKERTSSWVEAATVPGVVVVGTREIAMWPVTELGLAVVAGEGRRGMKDKSTPTTHARDLLVRRSSVERFSLVLADIVPTGEALGRASSVAAAPRSWGLVEVVDRSMEAPGTGLIGETARQAMSSVVGDGGRVLLFTHRRVGSQRCVKCRTVRSCQECGSSPGAGTTCARCGTTIGSCESCGGGRFEALGAGVSSVMAAAARVLGRDHVGEPGDSKPVVVVSERDLVKVSNMDLTVIVDADGLLMAPHYRANEDALRIMARAIAIAGTGGGRRGLVQTSDPSHPIVTALRRRDPVTAVIDDVARRSSLGFPPAGELVAVEARDLPPSSWDELKTAIGRRADVHGPAETDSGVRWLVQGSDLMAAKKSMRAVVSGWREQGARVRVDADPIDL